MTLEDAKAYMISNPGVKFTCQEFHSDEYIMYDESIFSFVFEDGFLADRYWWTEALSWNCDWWIVNITTNTIIDFK
jgi:hypothetical protein